MITNMFNEKINYELTDNERTLRYMLWMAHGTLENHYLYGDDGELNCNSCGIDFKRHTVKSIHDALSDQNMQKVIEAHKASLSK